MKLSSVLCRSQEGLQRERARNASLANVRIVAERAATAWAREAVGAEQREARDIRSLAIAEILAVKNQRSCDDDRSSSENPDRGFASP
jgi:hypothetical protein